MSNKIKFVELNVFNNETKESLVLSIEDYNELGFEVELDDNFIEGLDAYENDNGELVSYIYLNQGEEAFDLQDAIEKNDKFGSLDIQELWRIECGDTPIINGVEVDEFLDTKDGYFAYDGETRDYTIKLDNDVVNALLSYDSEVDFYSEPKYFEMNYNNKK